MTKLLPLAIILTLFGCNTSGKEPADISNPESPKVDSFPEKYGKDTITTSATADSIQISMGCGYAAHSSPQFNETKELVTSKQYDVLVKNLSSNDELTRILSVVALEEINKRKLYTLKANDKESILKIKKSKTRYYICIGCTGHYYGIISDIFEGKHEDDFLKSIQYKVGLADK
ncbi:MAG: hypothetical protein WAQ28_08750 [Bacteroidia bacterium]|jgi:hypothetical protein